MKRKIMRFVVALILVFSMVLSNIGTEFSPASKEMVLYAENSKNETQDIEDISEAIAEGKTNYFNYQKVNDARKHVAGKDSGVVIFAKDFVSSDKTSVHDSYEGNADGAVVLEEDGFVNYKVNIEQDGYYTFFVTYHTLNGRGIAMEYEVLIDNLLPYREASQLVLNRVWESKVDVRTNVDKNGNEMRPEQIEVFQWRSEYLKDGGAYYTEPMKVYLEKGEHEITFKAVRENTAISKIELQPALEAVSYDEYFSEYGKSADLSGDAEICVLEGESPDYKSSSMLIPTFDRASPLTSPRSAKEIKLNILGGTRWKIPGQWAEWEVEVPKDGMYKIALRARQNTLNGYTTYRKIMIDGEVPFSEAGFIAFPYSSNWNIVVPSDGDKEYLFHMTAGKHTIRIEAVLGEATYYLDKVQECLVSLNKDYHQILMITGSTPDMYRDYEFMLEIPEVFVDLDIQMNKLREIKLELEENLGYSGENTAIFDKITLVIETILDEPEMLPRYFNSYKNYIGALATWVLTTREQPLDIDVVMVAEPAYDLPKADVGFFGKIGHEVTMFFSTFFSDYNSIQGDAGDTAEEITVWTTVTRDHATILRNLIDDQFTQQNNISVDLQLIAAGSLLPSVLADIGPDVALGITSGEVMNYAAREATLDLSGFDGFEDATKDFMESALVPMRYEGGTYALPETQSFPVLFYRKDILEELGLEIPKTWNDVYSALAEIQKKNMTFAIGPGMGTYSMFLYQNGGELYKEGGKFSNIASDKSVDALRTISDLFISYKLPVDFDFANRFRTGEMPLGVVDYTTYNLLTVFAPEIKGLWGFTAVPGIEKDGVINNSVAGTVSGSVILKDTDSPEASWKFIKWFTASDAQVKYGRELESIIGTAARYNTANVEAMKGSAWRKDEINALMEQWESVVGIPEVPGGYYTSRYIDFAFRNVVNRFENERELLLEYEAIVNEEIAYKRMEFGLD